MGRTQIFGDQIQDETITGDDLQNTGVVPGTYTRATVTVDEDGRITNISSNTASPSNIDEFYVEIMG